MTDRLAAWTARIYRRALALAAPSLRQRYADDMLETFEARSREAASRGVWTTLLLLVRESADLVRSRLAGAPPVLAEQPPAPRNGPMTSIIQDIRYALRMLRRQPGFTVTAVATLAVGIGAATAVFTVVNGVLLRPLPYAAPDRLAMLMYGRPGRLSPFLSPLNYTDVVAQSDVFEDTAAIAPTTMNLTGSGDPERIEGARVSWNYFNVLGVTMAQGRGFVEAESRAAEDAVVISDALWRRRFGRRADIVGATAMLDGQAHTIVGVAPPPVRFPAAAEFWRPLVFQPKEVAPPARGAQWVMVLGRLRSGVSPDRAVTVLETVAGRLAAAYPRTNGGTTATAVALHERIVRNVRPTLLMLLGAVMLVLAVACVNVANLLLARAQRRQREVAVRAALGASRRRIVAQFMTESLLLAALGGAGGTAIAYGGIQLLTALSPVSIPRLADVAVDLRVLAFALATAAATSVVFGLVPAVSISSGLLGRWLGSARGVVGAGGVAMRRALVIAELALAVVLLVGAGLLIRSYDLLQRVAPGFDPRDVTTFNVSLPEAKYPTAVQDGAFVSTLLTRVKAQPGVEAAAAAFGLPFSSGFGASSSFLRNGEPDSENTPSAAMRIVTPDYFRMLRIPLVAGRTFDSRDTRDSAEVVVINQRAAQRFFTGDPIGQRIKVSVRLADVPSNVKTIVGIVGDVKYGGLDEEGPAEVYLPYDQHQVDSVTVAVRSTLDAAVIGGMLRREMASLDPELPLAKLQPMAALVDASLAERRFAMLLLASFAAVAVALAAVGVYGVLAYLVSQRTQEIGVRLAIGAAPGDVVRLVLREGAALALVGIGLGFAAALAAGQALAAMLFGITPRDPATLAIAAIALTTAALAASYLPARRAARVDPMEALRAE